MEELIWTGLFKEGWGDAIVGEAYSHPAKFARGLIRQIYAFAIENGWLEAGDWVVDPFGGVGLGAVDAIYHGVSWVGSELEKRFVDMGRGCDCTGISKEDWVRAYGRWVRFAYLDGRNWCPRCVAEAEKVTSEKAAPPLSQVQAKRRKRMRALMRRTGHRIDFRIYDPIPFPDSPHRPATIRALTLFGNVASVVSYERDSGEIPHTVPHYYAGNIDLFMKYAKHGARAVLLQGDSRFLQEILGAYLDGLIPSPPYATVNLRCNLSQEQFEKKLERIAMSGSDWKRPRPTGNYAQPDYGQSHGQLAAMPEGKPPDALISSSPYAGAKAHPSIGAVEKDDWGNEGHDIVGRRGLSAEYGKQAGQLAAMPEGKPPGAIVSSSPYARSETTTAIVGSSREEWYAKRNAEGRRYSKGNPANLGNMPEGGPDAFISSPPFGQAQTGGGIAVEGYHNEEKRKGVVDLVSYTPGAHGADPANLGNMPEGDAGAADGMISSPPYEESMTAGGHLTWQSQGQFEAHKTSKGRNEIYGDHPNQLGNVSGDTFWSAARKIMEQCFQILRPGGHAIFVTKPFVRDKKIVDFTGQWIGLCESVGFVLTHHIVASRTEHYGTQYDLDGEAHEKVISRLSFFRRIHAEKNPDLMIDWEDVICLVKPESGDEDKEDA